MTSSRSIETQPMEAQMKTDHITQHRIDRNDEPFWPPVQWGAAGIVLIGLLLFLPAAAWLLTAIGG
jgi:hypothetical protein